MKRLLTVGLLLLGSAVSCVPLAMAETYVDGEYDGPDYHYSKGYWWYKDGSPVVRIYDPVSYYYSYGYRYAYPRTYTYYRIPTYTEYKPAATAYTPEYKTGWQGELIKAAAARDEQNAYFGALKLLGLGAPIPAAYPYAQAGYVGTGYSNPNLGTYGANAGTLYGYSYEQVRQAYGETNINTMFQQSAQLARGAQSLAGQATSETNGIVANITDNQARLLEYFAKADAAAKALKAAELPPSSKTVTTVQGTGVVQGGGDPGTVTAEAAVQSGLDVPVAAVMTQRCASCHGDKDPKGQFRVKDFAAYNEAQRLKVLERLTSSDPDRRMPKGQPALASREIKAFLR